MEKSLWIKTADQLPEPGRYVLIHYNGGNWIDSTDPQNVYCVVAKLVEGISQQERDAMPDCERKKQIVFGDEHGNNLVPYRWDTFGQSSFFGQNVDWWMPIPEIN